MPGGRPFIDETGKTYGRLTVLERAPYGQPGPALWVCRCECENLAIVRGDSLRNGNNRSCGCLNDGSWKITHGQTRGGVSRIYTVWGTMKDRCFNPRNQRYGYYGGRGITVCDEWRNSFEAFYRDMGDPPAGQSLDRIDNNGNYEPDNCRWATPTEQARNRRPARPRRPRAA